MATRTSSKRRDSSPLRFLETNINTDGNNVQKWSQITTMHGVGTIFHSRSTCKKVIWAVFVLAALSGSTWFIIERLLVYLKFETSLSSKTLYTSEKQLEFPAATICNYNRFFYNKLALKRKLDREILHAYEAFSLNIFDMVEKADDESWVDLIL